MATNYARGAARERAIMALHRERGYTAIRSAGSHGLFDVVAFCDLHWKLIQAKSTVTEANAAMRGLVGFAAPPHTDIEVWLKLPRGWRIWRLQAAQWSLVCDGLTDPYLRPVS